MREVQAPGAPRRRRRGKGEGRGREEGGVGGERSSRVTSPPTRRRGHRRRRRHFNGALGLRSALSAQAKEPRRGASRSHSSALPAPPALRLSPHTRRTPHTLPEPLAALPFLFRPASPPSVHPSARSPTPPSPDLCQRPEGKRAARRRGGSRVSRRWRRLRAGRGYADSPAPAGSVLPGGSPRAASGTPRCRSPPPPLQRSARSPRCPPRGSGVRLAAPRALGRADGSGSAGSRTQRSPHLAPGEWNSPGRVLT